MTENENRRRKIFCWGGAIALFFFGGIFPHLALRAESISHRYVTVKRFVSDDVLRVFGAFSDIPHGAEFALRSMCFMGAALLIEMAFVGWNASSIRALTCRDKRTLNDFFCVTLTATQGFAAVSAFFSFGATYVVLWGIEKTGHPALLHLIPSVTAQLFIILVMRSLVIYWQHRLAHSVPFLWQFHKYHHSATVMTGLNDLRNTPLTVAMTGSIWVIVFAFLGPIDGSKDGIVTLLAGTFFMIFIMAAQVNTHVLHTKLETSYGWLGRHILASPAYHRIHHSALPEHRDRNFSTDVIFWDRLFGTYVDPKKVPRLTSIPLGFDDNRYDKGHFVYDYLFRPAMDGIRCLIPASFFRRFRSRSAL